MIAIPFFLVSLQSLAGIQQDELARLEMKPVEIRLPSGETKTAYRGILRVPIVRAKPDSKEIGVDVWRFPADDGVPEDRLPLFELHGGPGWPGLEAEDVDWEDDVAPIVKHGDLVIVDRDRKSLTASSAEFVSIFGGMITGWNQTRASIPTLVPALPLVGLGLLGVGFLGAGARVIRKRQR